MSDKIIRKAKNRENPYSMISNAVINDSRLSWKARGLMIYILSKPDDWCVYISQLSHEGTDGRESVESGIDELRYLGYVSLVCFRDDRGRVSSWEYVVHEEPIEVDHAERERIERKRESKKERERRKAERRKNASVKTIYPETGKPDMVHEPETGSPDLVSPLLDNPQLQNTDITKKTRKQKTDETTTHVVRRKIEFELGESIQTLDKFLMRWLLKHGENRLVDVASHVGKTSARNKVGLFRQFIVNGWEIKSDSAPLQVPDERYANFYALFPVESRSSSAETNDTEEGVISRESN